MSLPPPGSARDSMFLLDSALGLCGIADDNDTINHRISKIIIQCYVIMSLLLSVCL